ncbi:retron Ec78 anti-phage system effector HNH endonuclease PtuB [Acetobacter indonesiensis]|uniref:retron Ec78 anti-phage system effector HNH endonuclease PtuB n=1 Tax=Acetobacter indonesiensis TaxID=104101 RepID=UPI00314551C9
MTRGVAPACLSMFQHGRHNWTDVSCEQKKEIWVSLHNMQGKRCAYCECDIGIQKHHIEHFIQKGRVPSETFNWANLFGSCCIQNTCGDLKDRVGVYTHSNVLKPDIDDPDDFLLFVLDGTITPLKGLTGIKEVRAKTTLRILGLHHENGQLRNMRRRAVAGYIQTAESFAELSAEDPENILGWREELEEELRVIEALPFSTAIKHMFKAFLDCR